MQYTINRADKGKIEIKVDVPKAGFEEAYGTVLADLGREVKVDGFRPGNIPTDVIETKVGLTKVLNEAASFLVSKHLADIFDKENIIPITKPKVAIDSLAKGTPFSFVATLMERPKVKVGDWKKVNLIKIKAKEVTETDVDESIKNIFEAWSKQKRSNDTSSSLSASEGLTTNAEEKNDEELAGKFIYDAQGNRIPIKEDTSNKDKQSFSTNKSDESKIDDEFARAIGARDLAHLKELVRKDLETIVTDRVEQKFEEELFDELIKLSEVEVPDVMVDDEVNRIMLRLNQQLEQQGRKLEDWLRDENTTVDALRAKWRAQAEKNVKATLVLDEIGSSEKIQVTKEEIENAAKGVNQTDLKPEQKVDMERYLAISIFQAKTLELVKKAVGASS